MPLDPLPGKLVTYGRDENRDRWRRDYRRRKPGADTGEGTEQFLDGSAFADGVAPLYSNAITIANSVDSSTATGPALDAWMKRRGTTRLLATGASGSVTISASVGGTTIVEGDEITYAGLRYECAATQTYLDGAPVPIRGKDVGPSTNIPAGSLMKWSAPRPGCGLVATVVKQADGTGLSNGRFDESDAEGQARLQYLAANPPASGNDADYQAAIVKTPLISIQGAFTYSGIKGGSSVGVIVTLRPSQPGGNRIPNTTQLAAVLANLKGTFPANDQIFVGATVGNAINVNLKATWSAGVPGWTDSAPWPPYQATQVTVTANEAATPTFCTIDQANTSVAPQVGQTIAMFDIANGTFRRKKILTVTTASPGGVPVYELVFDTRNSASDTTYTPFTTQVICPWSDSLNSVIPAVLAYFDTLGPGEQLAGFFDPGMRQKRSPAAPQFWPSAITNRLITTIFAIPAVQDVALVDPAVPYAAPTGSPGVSAYLNELNNLAVFPQ